MLLTVGLLLLASLFLFAGFGHLTKHEAMSAYTASVLGDCPIKTQLAFLGGFPTGLYLVTTGVLIAFHRVTGLYMALGFLALVTGLFHRDLSDPLTFKNIALFGSVLALISYLN